MRIHTRIFDSMRPHPGPQENLQIEGVRYRLTSQARPPVAWRSWISLTVIGGVCVRTKVVRSELWEVPTKGWYAEVGGRIREDSDLSIMFATAGQPHSWQNNAVPHAGDC